MGLHSGSQQMWGWRHQGAVGELVCLTAHQEALLESRHLLVPHHSLLAWIRPWVGWQTSVLEPWSHLGTKSEQVVRRCSARSSGTGSWALRVSQQWRLVLGTEPNAGRPGEAPGHIQSHRGPGGTGKGFRVEVPALETSAGMPQLAGKVRFCQGHRLGWGTK